MTPRFRASPHGGQRLRRPSLHRLARAVLLLASLPAAAQTSDSTLIQTVTVSGLNALNPVGVSGFGDVPRARLPLSASVLNASQLQDAGIKGIGDLTRLNADVTDTHNAPGYWGQLAVRGYTVANNSQGDRQLLSTAVDWQAGPGALLEAEIEWSRQSQPSTPGFSLLSDRLPDANSIESRTNLNNQACSLPVVMAGKTGSLRYTQDLGQEVKLVAHAKRQRLDSDDRITFPYGYYPNATPANRANTDLYYDCGQTCDRYNSDGMVSLTGISAAKASGAPATPLICRFRAAPRWPTTQALFAQDELTGYLRNMLLDTKRSIYEHFIYDSDPQRAFTDALQRNDGVVLYAKLPSWFTVPTPPGPYNPDWALLLEQDGVQHLYFVVETKSSLFTDDLRDKESVKIECGNAHLAALGVGENPARYMVATSLQNVLKTMVLASLTISNTSPIGKIVDQVP